MEKKKVIKSANLPSKFPLTVTLCWITMLHYWGAPQWLLGVFGALLSIVWLGYIVSFWHEENVDLFDKERS